MKDSSLGLVERMHHPLIPYHRHSAYFLKLAQAEITLHPLFFF